MTSNPANDPQCSNRGVETLRKPYIGLDWMTCTFPLKGLETAKDVHQALTDMLGIRNDVLDVITPHKGFSNAVQLQIGRLDLQPDGLDGYASFELRGSDLTAYRLLGGQESETLKRLLARKGKPSRLDVAIDIFDDPRASITDLEADYRAGNVKTRATKARLIESLDTGGKTLYIGSEKSQTMLRAYDKAIQSNNLGELWTRLELQVRSKASLRLCQQIAKVGLVDSARWWFEKYRFNAIWYREMLASMKLLEPPKMEEKVANKRWWLENQVLPALRKLSDSEPATMAWFVQAVNQEFAPRASRKVVNRLRIRRVI